ncbi:MAG: tol-pal system protein YbgF [Alphaproteobacteria bacterium]|nr:MAG: tol-pal system protein YbgF [Alphaproteobacteria bacterium]
MQRRVFTPDTTYFPRQTGTPPATTGATPQAAPLLADLAVRVDALERQLRELTGRIEEVQHQNRTLANRLARFEQDIGLRLQSIETAAPAAGAAENTEPAGIAPAKDGAGQASPPELVTTRTPEEAAALLAQPGAPAGTTTAATPSAPAAAEGSDPEKDYEAAYALLRRGQIAEAEQAFRAFLATHRDHPLAGNAQYWLGETYYVRRDYARAAQAFLTGYQDFAKGPKAPDSLLKLAMSLAALGQTEDACAAFDQLEASYPDAEERIRRRMTVERSRIGCQ